MSPTEMNTTTQVLIVAAGAVFTLLLCGALWYWINQEWRALDARHHRDRNATGSARGPEESDESPTSKPPKS